MTSLVTEALASAGKLAKDDWNTKINKLNSRAYEIKRELSDVIEETYGESLSLEKDADDISKKLTEVRENADNLQNSFATMVSRQLHDANSEFEQLTLQHTKTAALVAALEKLYKVHCSLQSYDKSLQQKKFCDTLAAIKEIAAVLDSVKNTSFHETDMYKSLRIEVTVKRENLNYILDQIWKKSVTWTYPDEDGEGLNTKLSFNLSNENDPIDPQDMVYAMHSSNILSFKIKQFANLGLEKVFTPLIKNSDVKYSTASIATGCSISINKKDGSLELDKNPETHQTEFLPELVFNKVWGVLKFLNDSFLNLKLEKDGDSTLMNMFGNIVCEDIMTLLIDECLEKSVPNSKEELQNYDKITEVVKNFEKSLREIRFLTDEEGSGDLLAFVSDIHVHFANRRSTALVAKARQIMKEDIHETVEINDGGKDDVENFLSRLQEAKSTSSGDDQTLQLIVPGRGSESVGETKTKDILQFPRCRVSRCTQKLVELVYETLHEALTSSNECAMRLIDTVEDIFRLYQCDVPNLHKDALEMLPQVSAIHHNNCHYIAHHLLTVGQQLSSRLPSVMKGLELTFTHHVTAIRKLGEECFMTQMRRQRAQLMECLAPLKNFATETGADKYQMAEKPIKQVMYQLHHLRKVWRGVLPLPMFLRSISALVDSSIAEVVSSICSMEDISSDDSIQLKTICCILQDQLPSIFAKPEDEENVPGIPSDFPFQRSLKKWPRLLEIIFVLDASMREIVDRWADGKGPLASSFTVIETKGLIRALFQNTERRAAAISKIRY
uniref:Centromere/kinetochore protein zw10 homolog n=1 Tax=Phallusia mammillata TaxID=59560 RepID=A0A6F9DY57_9ASCI|nr:centromere/kinetochore protein zw10 homolog [Phallusia mammillata]